MNNNELEDKKYYYVRGLGVAECAFGGWGEGY